MQKTLLCHFRNEEYLLPWWLDHHKKIFDRAIMFDYHSTDRSREIIKAHWPEAEIYTSRNMELIPTDVDREIIDAERFIDGWKLCLNVTEHLVGDYSILDLDETQYDAQTQINIPVMMFIDRDRENDNLDQTIPLYEQKKDGFTWRDFDARMCRALHNHRLEYGCGRHYNPPTTDQLAIFYYGWSPLNKVAMDRKLSQGDLMPDWVVQGRHHTYPREVREQEYENWLKYTRDISEDIRPFVEAHQAYMNKT